MATDGDLRHLTSEQIQEFLDHGLAPEEEARVQEHLSVCPRCRSETEGWSLVFSELESLPEMDPGPAFSRAVLDQLPTREPVGKRVLGWIGAGASSRRNAEHLPAAALQDYAEEAPGGRRGTRVRNHLAACEPCRTELQGWERLFGTLSSLGRFAPSAGFAERVMARVRVPAPVPAVWTGWGNRVLGWARGLLPQTRRGWAVAGGIASAPTISMVALVYLVFSHPLLSVGTFTTYASWKVSALFGYLFTSLTSAVLESATLFRAYTLMENLAGSPLLVGAGGLAFSLTSAVALWVLYRYLIATPSVDDRHARARV